MIRRLLTSETKHIALMLSAAFAVLVAILLCMGELGLLQMDSINATYNDVTIRRAEKLRLVQEALLLSTRSARITMQVFLEQDESHANALLTEKAENCKKVTDLMAELGHQSESDKETHLLAAVEEAREPYTASYQRAVSLLGDKKKRDAAAVIVNETLPALVKYHGAWNKFAEFQKDQLDLEGKKAKADYYSTRRIAALFITLAVLVFLVIGVLATRQASKSWRQEVVARRHAEGELQRSQERINMAARAASIGFWERNLVTGKNTWSEITYVLLGLPPGSAASFQAFIDSVHPDDREMVQERLKAAIQLKGNFRTEFRVVWPDGSVHWLASTGRFFSGDDSRMTRITGIVLDIDKHKQAEATLRTQAAFLEAQANSTLDGILVVDGNGRRRLVNWRLIEIFKIPPEIVSDKDDQRMLEHAASLVKDSDSFVARVKDLYLHPSETSRDEIELKDGTILDRYSAPVIDENGIYYGRIWSFRDITRRKRNEDVLQQLSMAVEQSPVSVVITDPHGIITYVNDKFVKLTGYSRGEVVGKNPRILNSGRLSADVYRSLWSSIKQGHEWRGEFCNKKKNGEIYWESAVLTPITNVKGAITHFLAVKEDITERKRADQALRASEKRYRLLFERNMAGVFRTTLEGRLLECNQAAAGMFGYDSPTDILALPIATLYYESSDREAFLAKLKSKKILTNQEMRFRRKNGDSIWLIATFSLVDEDSAGGGIIEGTLIDITERKRAEEELYGSRQMLQSILDTIPQRVFWKDRNCVYLGCNRAFAIDAGLDTPAAIIGKTDFELAWNGVAELYRANDEAVMKQGTAKLNFEERQTRPDGSMLWLQTNKLPMRSREGIVTGVIGTYEDITERKRSDKDLRLTQFSLEHASDSVYWVDPHARIVYANQEACRASGWSREELHSLTILDIDPLFSIDLWQTFWLNLKSQGSTTIETQQKHKQGRLFNVEVTATYLDFDGEEYCFAFVRDVTERQGAAKKLQQMQFSLEHASDTVFWIDPQARIVYANEAASRALGHSHEELLTLSIPDIDPLFPKDVWSTFWERFKAQRSTTFETQHRTKQGRRFPVEVTTNYLEFDGQEYCFAFARDITERRALESQLRQAQKLEGIGQLAAGIAHEINTPTQFVTDNLTFLRDSWVRIYELLQVYRSVFKDNAGIPPTVASAIEQSEGNCDLDFVMIEVPRAIDQGLDGARRVAKIVRAMKEFSHPDSADKTATDLNRAIESTITVGRNEWKYVAEMATDFDETMSPVVCYPGDINQVVLNLVVNAAHAIKEKVKNGEKGQIKVCTRAQGDFAEISVTDTGNGIPEAIRTRVFDPFFTTKEVGKGTGQGLALAYAVVVKKHSGKIWFETEPGRGTTFFIDLPLRPVEAAEES
ncbi:MAG: PAS domain S-box protein [Terriglobales bacterium]